MLGFVNTWTLEISVSQPVRVYGGMPIGQLIYFSVEGEIEVMYNTKKNAKIQRAYYTSSRKHDVEEQILG